MTLMPNSTLIDTNIIIYYLNKQLPESVKMQIDEMILFDSSLSIITKIEVLGWQGHDEESLKKARKLLALFEEFALNEAVANYCVQLRMDYKIKLPDAIIAATALVNDKILITRNVDDFLKVKGLEVFNPLA